MSILSEYLFVLRSALTLTQGGAGVCSEGRAASTSILKTLWELEALLLYRNYFFRKDLQDLQKKTRTY